MSAATASAPAGYAWEATDDQVSERYGVELSAIVRFDLNTSPAPPDVALRALRSGAYGRPISEYPPSDYRDLVAAAADVYGVGRDELLVGAGADEVPAQVHAVREVYAPLLERRYDNVDARLRDLEQIETIASRAPDRSHFLADLVLDPVYSHLAYIA